MKGSRKEKRTHREDDESSDSYSHHRRRTKVVITSASDVNNSLLNKLEKAILFGDRKFDREPVVSEDIEHYRPPPGEEKQFPKMTKFNGRVDLEDNCDKYELLIIGMGHNEIILCKMFKTYLNGPSLSWYKFPRLRSIGSYEQLKRNFLRYYSHLCQSEKDTETQNHCR